MLDYAIKTNGHRRVQWWRQQWKEWIGHSFFFSLVHSPFSMFTVLDECAAQFFLPVTLATELFAYNYLGQQQFCIYHFYAFYIKNKFNNCFVSWANASTRVWNAICSHRTGSNFCIMSSTRLSRVLQPTHISPRSLPDGSDLLLYRNNDARIKQNGDDSVLCLKWPLHGKKTVWIFHLHFRNSPINHTHFSHTSPSNGWAESNLCIILLNGFFWWSRNECNVVWRTCWSIR